MLNGRHKSCLRALSNSVLVYTNKGSLYNCLSGCLLSMLFLGSEPKPLESKGETPMCFSSIHHLKPFFTAWNTQRNGLCLILVTRIKSETVLFIQFYKTQCLQEPGWTSIRGGCDAEGKYILHKSAWSLGPKASLYVRGRQKEF